MQCVMTDKNDFLQKYEAYKQFCKQNNIDSNRCSICGRTIKESPKKTMAHYTKKNKQSPIGYVFEARCSKHEKSDHIGLYTLFAFYSMIPLSIMAPILLFPLISELQQFFRELFMP